jgi:hypothetical protein
MSRFKPSIQRRTLARQEHIAPRRARMLSDRAYVDLSRQPELGEVPKQRPPYWEALATTLAFAFLVYLVMGGV